MRRRALLLATSVAATMVAMVAPLRGVASTTSALKPYSQAWLAANHTRYDTTLTANYEAQIAYNTRGATSTSAPAAPRIHEIQMDPGFLNNQNEFQIDINPLNHLQAMGASNDTRTSGTGFYATNDGGRTWTPGDIPGIGTSCCDPGVAYADDGTVYFINLDTSPAVVHFMKSTDNGATWIHVSDIAVVDRPNIAIDNNAASPFHGRIYLTWSKLDLQPFEIQENWSDDGGATWNGPINVSHVGATGAAYPQSSNPHVAADGTLYVGFQYYPNGTFSSAQNRIAKSVDGGVTFTPNTTINAGPNLQGGLDLGDARGYFAVNGSCATFRHRAFPIINSDPRNPLNVYAVWAGGNLETAYTCGSFSGRHSDVLFSKSTDGGATWSAPLKVNDDASGKDQYYPWMDVSPNGKIWVGWHDRRDDPSNFKHMYYMDVSRDGGATFGTDIKIASVASLPSTFIGDYAGLAAVNDLVLPMWWDSRISSNGDPFTAPLKVH
jgi:hypothetical protein